MAKNTLKIGLDLDGVVLFNPIRIFRPFTGLIKPLIFKKNKSNEFYFPHTSIEKFVWRLLHKTSLWPAKGMDEIIKMSKKNNVKLYLITSRYDFLKEDFEEWVKKLKAESYFAECIYNKDNLQPQLYKENLIEKLDLDIFVEDNWGIVEHLYRKLKDKGVKIFWISNILDQKINYPYKFMSLLELVNFLKKNYL
jgi:hypothetical protein